MTDLSISSQEQQNFKKCDRSLGNSVENFLWEKMRNDFSLAYELRPPSRKNKI